MTGNMGSDSQPPWSQVIATTLRLWLQRHVMPARVFRPLRGTGRRGAAVVLTACALVLAGSAAAGAIIAGQTSADRPGAVHGATSAPGATAGQSAAGTAPGSTNGSTALSVAAATRQQTAVWVAAQVSHAAIVACDPLMCEALTRQGFPAGDLTPISAASSDPLGTAVVIATPAVRSQLGSRLASVYAPVVLASFGRGASQIQVRATAVGGSAAFVAALQADQQQRQQAGAQLAGNGHIREPASARAELTGGSVDARLLITLAALANRFPVAIVSFSDAGPGAAPEVPLRELTVATSSKNYLRQLLTYLAAQRPPLRPVVTDYLAGRRTDVRIMFTAPSPTGLLSAGATQ